MPTIDPSFRYVWLIWASAFLIPWGALYIVFPAQRKVMRWASIFTAPFGLTEPLFVPAYWNPPSLFNLAQKTGFDIESIIFCFAIGGIGTIFYNLLTGRSLVAAGSHEKTQPLHRLHLMAMLSPFAVFLALVFFPWNLIYPAIVAMAAGGVAIASCRPDLKMKIGVGGFLFLAVYVIFLLGLRWLWPSYIERVWNLKALTGVLISGMPLEEFFFAFGFGMYWSGVYEHVMWKYAVPTSTLRPRNAKL